jgi:hypothetical protein
MFHLKMTVEKCIPVWSALFLYVVYTNFISDQGNNSQVCSTWHIGIQHFFLHGFKKFGTIQFEFHAKYALQ